MSVLSAPELGRDGSPTSPDVPRPQVRHPSYLLTCSLGVCRVTCLQGVRRRNGVRPGSRASLPRSGGREGRRRNTRRTSTEVGARRRWTPLSPVPTGPGRRRRWEGTRRRPDRDGPRPVTVRVTSEFGTRKSSRSRGPFSDSIIGESPAGRSEGSIDHLDLSLGRKYLLKNL